VTANTLFSIDNPTLNRFYSLHYTLPFILAGLSIFHIAALHQYGSTNPLGVNTQTSTVPFSVYFVSKDLLGLLFLLFAFAYLVFFYPELLGHPFVMAYIVIKTICKIALYAGNYALLSIKSAENHYLYYFNIWIIEFSETTRAITLLSLVIVIPFKFYFTSNTTINSLNSSHLINQTKEEYDLFNY